MKQFGELQERFAVAEQDFFISNFISEKKEEKGLAMDWTRLCLCNYAC